VPNRANGLPVCLFGTTIDGATARAAGAILASFALALALTLVVELAVAALAFRLRTRRELGVVTLANVLTNPALNLALMLVMALTGSSTIADPPALAALVVLEVAAVVVEWRILGWALPEHHDRALGMSLTMNVASLVTGLALHALGVW